MNEKLQEYSIQISTPDQFTPPEDRLGRADHTWHGAAIIWHESLDANIQCIGNTHDRFTGIKMNFTGVHFLAISAYLPTSGKDDDFLSCLGELSCFIADNIDNIDTVLIGMDSNCSEKSTPRRTKAFQQFCHEQSLIKFSHSEPTFHHSNGLSASNIDYFLISQRSVDTIHDISSQCNQDYPENFSSHDPFCPHCVYHVLTLVAGRQRSMATHILTSLNQESYGLRIISLCIRTLLPKSSQTLKLIFQLQNLSL